MRKVAALSFIVSLMLVVFGCSESPNVTGPEDHSIVLVERPQFVDTRPTELIEQHTIKATAEMIARKKPPKPPKPDPDPGGDDPNPDPAHKYAYIVGISDYEGSGSDLQFADDDARDMKALLQGEGFTCRIDTDRSATADAIVAGLNWLVSVAEPGDEIAFCYSGHGAKAPGSGSSLISTDLYYVTHGYAMGIFNQANCTKKLVTIDACVIGDFHSDCETGTMMATASNRTNSYDAPDLNQGAWTYYFLRGHNVEDLIYAEPISDYAEDGMKAWASQYKLRVSPKHTDRYTGSFDI